MLIAGRAANRSRMSRAAALCLALVLSESVAADTALRFAPPPVFGSVRAAVLDETGERVGEAEFVSEKLVDGRIQLRAKTRLESGAGSETGAVLAPAGAKDRFKLVSEHSQTFAPGRVLAVETRIDHGAQRARCSGSASDGGELALASDARVANVPVQLLLGPFAASQQQRLDVDVVVCRGSPRLLTMRAERKRAPEWPARARVVEVEYGPSGFLGAIAGLVAPRASFWFDPSERAPWIAHRLPLEPGRAPVIVLRTGVDIAPTLLSE